MLQDALLWIQNLGSIGAIAFIGLYVLATVLLFPGTLLTLGAGVVFGVLWGSIYVFVGATLGATIAFLMGRYFAREWVAQRIKGKAKIAAIDDAIAKEGLKIVILTRLSPIFPFIFLNYALSLTRVSLQDYVLGSIGMIPGTITYVYLGALAGNIAMLGRTDQPLTQEAQLAQWGLRILGLIATIVVTVYITRIAQKTLQERVSDEPLEQSESSN
jgi:uncharacterized membrane protein YdjX (TVP38/TMEM64 family)